jgi:phosphatidylglycerol:prolipoprotein diacylglycerol transferase
VYPYIHLGSLEISTYFFIISVATVIAQYWFIRRAEKADLSRVMTIDLTLVILAGGLVGARLMHVLYEEPAWYHDHPADILRVWNGGFVYWGGAMGAGLAAYTYCTLRRIPFLFMADLAALPISLAYSIGRMACFFNGCCYGRHCDLPWAVFMNGEYRHPTQLYASFWELGSLAVLVVLQPRLTKVSGRLFGTWLILHAMGRLVMEQFRADPRGELLLSQSLGSWISLIACVLGIILFEPFSEKAEKRHLT